MKKQFLLLGIGILMPILINAQGGSASNTRIVSGQFLGWNLGIIGPLNIRNDFNERINFNTNTFNRVFIDKGFNGQTGGRVAFGNALTVGFTPVDRVNLFEAAVTGSVQVRFQNTNTGALATDGYAIGVNNATRVVNHTQFEKKEMRWLLPAAQPQYGGAYMNGCEYKIM